MHRGHINRRLAFASKRKLCVCDGNTWRIADNHGIL